MTDWDVMRTGRTVCVQPQTRAPAGQASSDDCDIPQDDLARVSPPNHQVGVETKAKQTDITEDCGGKVRKICCEMVSGGLFYSEEETA